MKHRFLLCFPLVLLTACAHVSERPEETRPVKFRVWQQAPGLEMQEALAKALAAIKEQKVDLSHGYILEISRGTNRKEKACWEFVFQLLPLAPDYGITVRVDDSGQTAFGLYY